MPIYSHQEIEEGGIVIWRIEETSDALYSLLDTSCYDAMLAAISHEARRAEWLAVRVLIAQTLGADKVVAYHPSGCPYLTDGSYHISISHTKRYAAVAYHRCRVIGVDIEHIAPRVLRIAHRFTHPDESLYIDRCGAEEKLKHLLVNWSTKETLFKLLDNSSASDFRETFRVCPYELEQYGVLSVHISLSALPESMQSVFYRQYPDFVCTWAVQE